MKIDDAYVTIQAGSKVSFQNPAWDGDDPSTQFSFEGTLDQDMVVYVGYGSGDHPIEVKNTKRLP